MKNLQLFEALKSLSLTEFREFGKFVRSPYFNSRSEVIRFYDEIKKFYPTFESKSFTEEIIFTKVYPGKKHSSVLLRKLVSLMLNLLLRFFAELKFRNNELEYSIELLESLRDRKLFGLHDKKLRIFNEYLNNAKQTMEIYEYQYKLENELRNIDVSSGEKARLEKAQDPLEKIYSYFFSVILNEHLSLLVRTKSGNKKFDLKLFNEIINYVKNSGDENYPLLYLYYLLLMLMSTHEEKFFYELLEFRIKNFSKLEAVHNYNAVIVLIDYCIIKIRLGNKELRKTMFSLSQSLVKEDLLSHSYTEPATFTNVIRNSAFLNEINWSIMFINKYKDGLNPVLRDSVVNYTMGMVEFSRGNFEESLQLLASANVKWNYMKYDLKKITLKNNYELGYYEDLLLQIDAYKHYLKKDLDIKEDIKQDHNLFINFITRLNNIKLSENFQDSELLKKDLLNSIYFCNKEWVIEKTEELIKKAEEVCENQNKV